MVLVELEDVGDGPLEEGPVVRHHHDDAGEALDEGLQPAQTVEVEVVRGLVEEQDVHPGQQDRGQRQPGPLPARQRGGRLVEHPLVEPEVLADLGDPGVEVGRADRHPALQRGVVPARRVGRARGDLGGGRLELGRGLGHAGAAGQQRPAGLAGTALRLLREQGDGRGRWGDRHRAGVGSQPAGEHGQERRLADPVRAHDAEAGTGTDGQVDATEDGAPGTVDDQVARDDGDGGGRRQGTPFGRAPARAGSDGQGLCSLHGGARYRPRGRTARRF